MNKRRVVIGVLGTVLDKRGKRANRLKKWRPTVGLCQQADFPVDRLELIHQPHDESLAQKLIEDIALLSPQTEVRPHRVEINDPWDFEEVYAAFLDFASRYSFDTENEEYLVHITTGTHVAQICWFLLTEARYLPANLLQTGPAPKGAVARQFSRTQLIRGAYGDAGRAGTHYAGRCGRGDYAAERELAADDVFS